jgi:hypothetical protein
LTVARASDRQRRWKSTAAGAGDRRAASEGGRAAEGGRAVELATGGGAGHRDLVGGLAGGSGDGWDGGNGDRGGSGGRGCGGRDRGILFLGLRFSWAGPNCADLLFYGPHGSPTGGNPHSTRPGLL